MNEIYVIFQGCYSDWEILGFCETEEEAIKSCVKYNRQHERYEEDSVYYERASRFNVGTLDLIKPNYVHRIYFHHESDGWKFRKMDNIDVYHDAEMNNKIDIDYNSCLKSGYAYVCLKEINREKALKIAQDMLYKKLAEEEGL